MCGESEREGRVRRLNGAAEFAYLSGCGQSFGDAAFADRRSYPNTAQWSLPCQNQVGVEHDCAARGGVYFGCANDVLCNDVGYDARSEITRGE